MRIIPELLEKIDTGKNVIYRGHASHNWVLKPSIGRNYKGEWKEIVEIEEKSLSEFKKKSIPYIKHKPGSDIEWLALMQHHGLSTRLLDFTTNPLIALFFASEEILPREDGELIVATYNKTYEEYSNTKLFHASASFAYHPPHITERIVGQQGCFILSSSPNLELAGKQITRLKISKSHKSVLRRELLQLGISHSSLFPGIDGICKDVNEALESNIWSHQMPF